MASNNLSFAVSLQMLNDNFKRGLKEVQTGFGELKATALNMVGFFGLGLGLQHIAKEMVNVARETGAAQKALKVASGGLNEFGENQKFIVDLSEKLGLNVNQTTTSFARFTASAKASNISIKDQQNLFKGLNSALLAVGAGGDAKAEAIDAVSKMMQKGTITTKMLVGGLGQALPESLSIMAKSLGVSTDQLREMAKHGQLTSASLVKFGDELNRSFADVNSDTITGALNRISNTFEELTQKVGAGDIYKNIVKTFGEGFKWVVDNLTLVGQAFVNVIAVTIIGKAFKSMSESYFRLTSEAETSFVKQEFAARKAALTEQVAAEGLTGKVKKERLKQVYDAEKALIEQEFATKGALTRMGLSWKGLGIAIKSAWTAFAPMLIIEGLVLIGQYIYGLYEKQRELNKITSDYQDGLKKASSGFDTHSQNLKSQVSLLNNLKLGDEQRKTALSQINSILGTHYEYGKLNVRAGEDLNQKIRERLKLYQLESQYKYMADKGAETKTKLFESDSNVEEDNRQLKSWTSILNKLENKRAGLKGNFAHLDENDTKQYLSAKENIPLWNSKLKNDVPENQALHKINDQNDEQLNKLLSKNPDLAKILNPDSNIKPTGDGEQTAAEKHKEEIFKAQEAYDKKTIELNNLKENSILKEYEFHKEFDKHVEDGKKSLGGILTPEEGKNNDRYKQITDYKPQFSDADKQAEASDKLVVEKNKYAKELGILIQKHRLEQLTDDQFNKGLEDLNNTTVNTMLSIDNIGNAADLTIKGLKDFNKTLLDNKHFEIPKEPEINHTFDYRKKDVEKLEDKKQQNDDYIKLLETQLKDAGVKDVKKLMANANCDFSKFKGQFNDNVIEALKILDEQLRKEPDLAKQLNLLKVKQEIKDLQKQLNNGLYNGMKDVANSAKNVYSSLKTIGAIKPSKEWETFFSVWDTVTSVIDSINSVIKLFKDLGGVISDLGAAKEAEQVINTSTSAAKIATNVAETASYTALGAAESFAAYAAIPFAGQGLALAQIGVMQGAILASGIPKLANGGIAYGNSLVNVGEYAGASGNPEVIAPLDKLKTLIKPTESNVIGGEVKFVIDGKVIKGVLDNYSNIKSKVTK